jgi:sulfoxide reductase heme-binding subunit YedZ
MNLNEIFTAFSHLFPVWNTTRAAGLTSYVLLFVSIIAGMLQSFHFIAPTSRKMLNILHQSSGWFGLLFGMVHGSVLLFDHDTSFSLKEIFVPFASHTNSLQIGIGIIAFYLMFLLMVTSDLMKQLGRKLWRTIHYLSFPTYMLAFVHGVLLGPDTRYPEILFMYVVTAGMVIILFVLRMTYGKSPQKGTSLTK